MKFRKSRPPIAASIGRMIVLSIPRRPDADPGRGRRSLQSIPRPSCEPSFRDVTQAPVDGGGGIRTPGDRTATTVFKTAALNRSATPPRPRC